MSDSASEGHYVSLSTGQEISFTLWGPDEPNEMGGEDCVELIHDSSAWIWNDKRCGSSKNFICEKK